MPSTMHYLYVRGPSRRQGLGRYLTESLMDKPIHATHWTPHIEAIATDKGGIIYTPGRLENAKG